MSLENLYQKLKSQPSKFEEDGDASLYSYSSESGQKTYALAARHYSKQALDLVKENILPKVENDPDSWYFLIEGSKTSGIPEVEFSQEIAKRYEIPVDDPIINPFDKRVIKKAIKEGVNENDAYLALSLGLLAISKNRESALESLAKQWDIKKNHLESLLTLYALEPNKDEEKKRLKETTDRLTSISNELSQRNLEELLKRTKKKNVFIYLGKFHKSIVDSIYKP